MKSEIRSPELLIWMTERANSGEGAGWGEDKELWAGSETSLREDQQKVENVCVKLRVEGMRDGFGNPSKRVPRFFRTAVRNNKQKTRKQ